MATVPTDLDAMSSVSQTQAAGSGNPPGDAQAFSKALKAVRAAFPALAETAALAAVATSGSKADVGLDQVDNTSDLAKPVSAAVQTELDAKRNLGDPINLAELPSASTFTRRYDGTAWPARGTSRSDLVCLWVSATAGAAAPPGRLAGVDLVLMAQA